MTELHLLYVVIVQAHVIPQIALGLVLKVANMGVVVIAVAHVTNQIVEVVVQAHVVAVAVAHVTKQIVKMGVLVGVLSSVLQIVRMGAMVIAVMDVTIGAMEAAN